MNNLNSWKKQKILFVLSDPGSSNIILSIIKKFKLKRFNIYLSKRNKRINLQKYVNQIILKAHLKKKKFNLCVIGTGDKPKYISLANSLKKKNIHTIAILDHWLNFVSRFKKAKEVFKPDTIFLTDYNTYTLSSFFKNIKIINIKNYYMEEKIKEIKRFKKKKYDFLYISDPATYVRNKKIRNQIILDSIKNFLNYLKLFNKLKILIRPHPNENLLTFKKIIKKVLKENNNNKLDIIISEENNISKDIGCSKIIFGMQSSALLLAKKCGKRVYTSMSSKLIKRYVINNHLKNKIKNIDISRPKSL